jgi:hypothetical protein
MVNEYKQEEHKVGGSSNAPFLLVSSLFLTEWRIQQAEGISTAVRL